VRPPLRACLLGLALLSGCAPEPFDCARQVALPEATVPDDFAIHRHRDLPMYVVTFSRTDVPDDGVRVLLQAHMLSSIGSLMIEHSLDDTASFMIGDDHDDD
jgi:hypothetical protein